MRIGKFIILLINSKLLEPWDLNYNWLYILDKVIYMCVLYYTCLIVTLFANEQLEFKDVMQAINIFYVLK